MGKLPRRGEAFCWLITPCKKEIYPNPRARTEGEVEVKEGIGQSLLPLAPCFAFNDTKAEIDNAKSSSLRRTSRTPRALSFSSLPPEEIPPTKMRNVPAVKFPKVNKGRALDLFSGTGSVGARLIELGYEVISLDIDPKTNPTILTDILVWDYKEKPPGYFRLIAASVPCTEYSLAKTTAPRDMSMADELVSKVVEIFDYFNPKYWWSENPPYGFLRFRDVLSGYPYVDIDYCRFSDWGYQKPTRFWGSPNLGELPHVRCRGWNCKNVVRTPQGFQHKERLGGNQMHFNSSQKAPPGD